MCFLSQLFFSVSRGGFFFILKHETKHCEKVHLFMMCSRGSLCACCGHIPYKNVHLLYTLRMVHKIRHYLSSPSVPLIFSEPLLNFTLPFWLACQPIRSPSFKISDLIILHVSFFFLCRRPLSLTSASTKCFPSLNSSEMYLANYYVTLSHVFNKNVHKNSQ